MKPAVRCVVFAVCFVLETLVVLSHGLAEDVAPPSFHIVDAGPETPVPVSISSDLRPKPVFEISPILVEGAPGEFFVSTGWSWLCRDDDGLFSREVIVVDKARCRNFSAPLRIDRTTGRHLDPSEVAATTGDWRRSYAGVVSALRLPAPRGKYSSLAIVQGENKNERIGERLYANTVDPKARPEACASGYQDGSYQDCYPAYHAFVSLQLWGESNGPGSTVEPIFDAGPVVWPSSGYRKGDQKTSGSIRHPSAIVAGDYLYIFYLDTSHGNEEGRRGGVHLARMPLRGADMSTLPAAVPYYNGTFSADNPSLPPGFDKDKIRDFYEQPGGRASELWPKSWGTGRFSVARLKGTPYLLGVEEYVARKAWAVQLRISADLVHWSDPVLVPGAQSDVGWSAGTMHYPVFADLDGRGTNEIDPAGFYLVAAQRGGIIVRRRVSIEVIL